jgi:hypothetical protein
MIPLMIASLAEPDPTAEVVMYFTGLPPALRVRAAALVAVTDRVMAMRDVARAKVRMLDFMAVLLFG